VGPHRVFDAAEFPRDDAFATDLLGDEAITRLGDSTVGGALRRYLQAKKKLPEEGSLASGIPLNMRTRREVTDDNNQVGSVYTSLHTDIEDPLERIAAIKQSMEEAKQHGETSPLVNALMLAGVFSPAVSKTLAGFWSRNEISRFIPLNISTVVTNVRGPDFPLYCAGAKLVDYYALGVLTPGMGVFHAIFSYAGKITLSVLADRNIMPDVQFYHDCLVASYEELYNAASELNPPAGDSEAAIAARATIDAPRRKRAVSAAGAVRPKSVAQGKAAAAGAKTKTKAKARAKPKSGATATPKAKPKSKAKAKAKAKPKTAAKAGKAPARRKAPARAKAKRSANA